MSVKTRPSSSTVTSTTAARDRSPITVQPLGGSLGALVDDVTVSGDLSLEVVAALRSALLRHKVLFLTDQHQVDDIAQHEFAQLFGPATNPHPTVRGVHGIGSAYEGPYDRSNGWYTDASFVHRVPAISLLRPRHPAGGMTLWADTVAAHRRLHPALKAVAEKLWAVHINVHDHVAEVDELRIGGIDVEEHAEGDEFTWRRVETEHPAVHVHPETKERALLLGQYARRFVGLSGQDSADLHQLLQRHITRPENTVGWTGSPATWRSGTTAPPSTMRWWTEPRTSCSTG